MSKSYHGTPLGSYNLFFSIAGVVAAPDAAVTKLEDAMIKKQASGEGQLVGKMKGVNLNKGRDPKPSFNELLPARPAFGTLGSPCVVWANYFKVDAKPITLYKYGLEVTKIAKETPKDGKAKPPGEVRGRKLHLVIADFIRQLQQKDRVVTEFKSQLIALAELKLEDNPVVIRLTEPALGDGEAPLAETFHVKVTGPTLVSLAGLLDYLTSMAVPSDDVAFPRYPEAIDALNMILGFRPRSKLDQFSVLGGSRFFPFDDTQVVSAFKEKLRPLLAARGLFQSARIGTGRLLLNTNVTHGVFKASGRLDKVFRDLGVTPAPRSDGQAMRQLKLIAKLLPKTRVWVTFNTSSGRQVKRTKAIEGLAVASELSRRGPKENRDKFAPQYEFCGPRQVSFFLADENRYTTVHNYYSQSKQPTNPNNPH